MWEAVQDNWPSLSKTDVMEKKKNRGGISSRLRDQKHQMQRMTLNESSFEK